MGKTKTLPRLAIFGDSNKKRVAKTIDEFSDFAKGKAEIIANCSIESCPADILEDCNFVVVFGGDGAIISAARNFSRSRVPVVGVNVGKLGFMAEFSVGELEEFFPTLASGAVATERRMMLNCSVFHKVGRGEVGASKKGTGTERFRSVAINDVFITAGPPFRTIEGIGTAAWKKLDRGALWVLLKFYEKFNGYNRYDLSVTYKEVKYEMSSRTFSRSIWQLIGYGFLDVRRFGRLERYCSIYGLSNRWRALNNEPEKLEQIENNLKKIEYLKRQPGSLGKRIEIHSLRNKLLKIGRSINSGKNI